MSSAQPDEDAQVEEGYYLDVDGGNIAQIAVEDGVAKAYDIDPAASGAYASFTVDQHPEDHDFSKVSHFAVEDPLGVAQAIYRHGYLSDGEIRVRGKLVGPAEIEFVDTVTQLAIKPEYQGIVADGREFDGGGPTDE